MTMLQSFKKHLKRNPLIIAYGEYRLRNREIERFTNEAISKVQHLSQDEQDRILKAYIRDLKKHMFTFDEWMNIYKLYGKEDKLKRTYISRSEAQKCYRTTIKPEVRSIFHNKELFLKKFSKYIRRKYVFASSNTTQNQIAVRDLLAGHDAIVKPHDGSLGAGIYKLRKIDAESTTDSKIEQICKDRCLVEECIVGCDEIQRFHPESLNTIRVVTAFDGKDYSVFYSFIRMGSGKAVVDNAHAGGFVCPIDVATGRIKSDAFKVGEAGNIEFHPDSNQRFKGFQIPKWNAICKECTEAHHLVDIPFVGWDVCINQNNEVEFIEGNHAPDMDVCQSLPNSGLRDEFLQIISSYKKHRK